MQNKKAATDIASLKAVFNAYDQKKAKERQAQHCGLCHTASIMDLNTINQPTKSNDPTQVISDNEGDDSNPNVTPPKKKTKAGLGRGRGRGRARARG